MLDSGGIGGHDNNEELQTPRIGGSVMLPSKAFYSRPSREGEISCLTYCTRPSSVSSP